MTDLGELAIWIALLMAAWGAALSFAGGALGREAFVSSGRRGLYAAWGFVVLAAIALWWALLLGDLSLRYVASFTEEDLPWRYRLSAFWAGSAGSMLFWALSLSSCLALALAFPRRGTRELRPWVGGATGSVLTLFLAASTLRLDPFARLATAVADGRGLDPAMQHPAAAMQPPLLYFGYMATLVAIVMTVVAVIWNRRAAAGLASARAWSAAAWSLLLGGALVGLWRAYIDRGSPGLAAWRALPLGGSGNRFSVPLAFITSVATLTLGELLAAFQVRWADPAATPAGRRWRRAGRLTLAIGSFACIAGLAGAARAKTLDISLRDGEAFTSTDPWGRTWTLTSQGASRIQRANHFAVGVALRATRDGSPRGFIAAEQREYVDSEERDRFPRVTVPGILRTTTEDVYVVLTDAGSGRADLRIAFIPLVAWIWIGGVLAAAGGAMAMWPGPEPERRS